MLSRNFFQLSRNGPMSVHLFKEAQKLLIYQQNFFDVYTYEFNAIQNRFIFESNPVKIEIPRFLLIYKKSKKERESMGIVTIVQNQIWFYEYDIASLKRKDLKLKKSICKRAVKLSESFLLNLIYISDIDHNMNSSLIYIRSKFNFFQQKNNYSNCLKLPGIYLDKLYFFVQFPFVYIFTKNISKNNLQIHQKIHFPGEFEPESFGLTQNDLFLEKLFPKYFVKITKSYYNNFKLMIEIYIGPVIFFFCKAKFSNKVE